MDSSNSLNNTQRKSVWVYGPRGCGKTSNAEKLKNFFNLKTIVDNVQLTPGDRIPVYGDALILSNDPPPDYLKNRYDVWSFQTAMKTMFQMASTVQITGENVAKGATANDLQVAGEHYKDKNIQPWDFIAANKLDYFQGNIVKYVCRFKDKNGLEDLKKAQHYLQKLIELEQLQIDVARLRNK